jgi:hypothetical protein
LIVTAPFCSLNEAGMFDGRTEGPMDVSEYDAS